MCAKKWDIRAANDYGKDRCHMSQEILNGKARYPMMKWDGKVPCLKFCAPWEWEVLMCNEISSKQQEV